MRESLVWGLESLVEVDWTLGILELRFQLFGIGRCPLGEIGDGGR